MAKDVVTFLSWAAEPEHDDRKLMGAKFMFALSLALFQVQPPHTIARRTHWSFGDRDPLALTLRSLLLSQAGYYKRWKWSHVKSRRVIIDAVN